ncbi:CHAPERONE-LIKE PROTEIN [Drosera capensis]
MKGEKGLLFVIGEADDGSCDVHGLCDRASATRSSIKCTKVALKRGLCVKQPKCALDASHGGNVSKFPRVKVWDPYKLLGISRYASSEEIWSSRNFLLQQYAGDERSVESIEAAFEKLVMRCFRERKATKMNLKARLKRKAEESPVLAGWSIMNSVETGPAFQVAVALGACVYFLYDKTKNGRRGFILGFGSLVAGVICGSCVAPAIPTAILPPTWTLEMIVSMVVYVFLFLESSDQHFQSKRRSSIYPRIQNLGNPLLWSKKSWKPLAGQGVILQEDAVFTTKGARLSKEKPDST